MEITASIAGLAPAGAIHARIILPRTGAWRATLALDTPDGAQAPALGARVDLAGEGDLALRGAVQRAQVVQDVLQLRVIGGAGGLNKVLPPRWYRGPDLTARVVLRGWAEDAAETLSDTIDAALFDRRVEAWTRPEGRAHNALGALADALGVTWRVLADGTVWLGEESWPAVELTDADVLREDAAEASVEIATDTIAADLVPGVMFTERRVSCVEHILRGADLRTVVLFERARGGRERPGLDRLRSQFESAVRAALPEIAYLGVFRARVVTQNSDGTCDIAPEDPRWPDLTKVPIRYGVAGARARLRAGNRVGFGFENADPTRPIIVTWELGGVDEVRLNATDIIFNGGASPVAHEGSGTSGHSHAAGAYVAGPYAVTGTSATAADTIATGEGSAHVLVPDT